MYTASAFALAFLALAGPARAQFQPRVSNDLATGERYHIEAAAGLWFPIADLSIASSGGGALTGILGTTINAKSDLGLTNQHFPEFRVELRPARSHKLRFQYIPLLYEQSATFTRDIKFNGQLYRIGIPVSSTIDWKAYRFAYEFDFLTKSRGYAGFLIDAKYTDVTVNLTAYTDAARKTAFISEFARARAPIPAIGGVGRFYVLPNVSITGEVSGFKLPEGAVKDSGGHYVDVDIYGTYNLTNNIGVQAGFRSFDVGYIVKTDSGSFVLKGVFFGVVARY